MMSGIYPENLERKRFAGAEDARLDLIGNEQRSMLMRHVARYLHELARERMHAALPLDGFEHDGADLIAQASKMALSSSTSFGVHAVKPTGNGRKLSCNQSCMVAAMVSSVRP